MTDEANHRESLATVTGQLFAEIESALRNLNAVERTVFAPHLRSLKLACNYVLLLGTVADGNAKE